MEPGFQKRLAPVFAKMPEFRETHVVGKQMKGVQLADTLFLPENVELTGDTVIIANNMIFSGKNAVIKGPHDLHFFALGPLLSLTMNARDARGQSSTFVEVAFSKPRLVKAVFSRASIEETKRAGQLVEPDRITLNVDGRGRDEWLESQKAAKARFANHARRSTTQQQENIDKVPGETGDKGANGTFSTEPETNGEGPPGLCPSIPDGSTGDTGHTAPAAGTGGTGLRGIDGEDGGTLNITVTNASDTHFYNLSAKGGRGGQGGPGGDGGFLPVVERVGEVDRVILVPARYSREGVAGAAQVEKAAGWHRRYGWARCGWRQRRQHKLHLSLRLAPELGLRRWPRRQRAGRRARA